MDAATIISLVLGAFGSALSLVNTVHAVRRDRPRFRARFLRARNFHVVRIENAGLVPVVIERVELHRKGSEALMVATDKDGHSVKFPQRLGVAAFVELRFPVWTKDDARWRSVRGVFVAGVNGQKVFLRGIRYLGE